MRKSGQALVMAFKVVLDPADTVQELMARQTVRRARIKSGAADLTMSPRLMYRQVFAKTETGCTLFTTKRHIGIGSSAGSRPMAGDVPSVPGRQVRNESKSCLADL